MHKELIKRGTHSRQPFNRTSGLSPYVLSQSQEATFGSSGVPLRCTELLAGCLLCAVRMCQSCQNLKTSRGKMCAQDFPRCRHCPHFPVPLLHHVLISQLSTVTEQHVAGLVLPTCTPLYTVCQHRRPHQPTPGHVFFNAPSRGLLYSCFLSLLGNKSIY